MAQSDIVLRFHYSNDANVDTRNFRVYQVIENNPERLEVYRVCFLSASVSDSNAPF